MTMAYAQMNSCCGTENGARSAARAFALICILMDIVLAMSIIICLDGIAAAGLLFAVILLGALCVRLFVCCQRAVG